MMHLALKLTWLSPLWSVGGLSVSDRDMSQLGQCSRFDCFSYSNLIPLTHLKESSWIGFLTSQDTKAVSGRFSTRPVVLLWHSVKPLSLIIQRVVSARQICMVKDMFQDWWWFPESNWSFSLRMELLLIITLVAAVVWVCDLLCFSWLLF